MDKIKIENDKYELYVTYPDSVLISFKMWQGTRLLISMNVMLRASAALYPYPEKWLLELAEGEIVRDEEGRRIRLGKEQLYLDIDGEFGPTLPLTYYGFTADQLRTAIKETLAPAPAPKVDLPDWFKDGVELRYSPSWGEWLFISADGSCFRLSHLMKLVSQPILIDLFDKTKVYVKGAK